MRCDVSRNVKVICPRCGKKVCTRGSAWKSRYFPKPVVVLFRHRDDKPEGVRRPCTGGSGTFVVEALRFDRVIEIYDHG